MRTAVALLFGCLCLGRAEIIDRIAVTLDNSVITESEILRQIRVTALLNNEQPVFTAQHKRDTADRLIEQALIHREMQLSRFTVDAKAAAEASYKELRKRFANEQKYKEALAAYRLTDAEVREAMDWQATFLEFIVLRFRPGIQIPEDEIRDYYNREIANARVPYEEARADIESILTSQRVDNALDRWLGQARTQTRILYKQEAFR